MTEQFEAEAKSLMQNHGMQGTFLLLRIRDDEEQDELEGMTTAQFYADAHPSIILEDMQEGNLLDCVDVLSVIAVGVGK